MKYIRTEEGIFEDEYVHIKVDKYGYAVMEYQGDFYKPPKKVEQADTIEELCDEFVIKGKNWYQIISLENAKSNAQIGRLNELEIYGAIWTDKGLIYVAKMNDKGELELL